MLNLSQEESFATRDEPLMEEKRREKRRISPGIFFREVIVEYTRYLCLSAHPHRPVVGAPQRNRQSQRNRQFYNFSSKYTVYQHIGPGSKKNASLFSCAALAASIDASLSCITKGGGLRPYLFS